MSIASRRRFLASGLAVSIAAAWGAAVSAAGYPERPVIVIMPA